MSMQSVMGDFLLDDALSVGAVGLEALTVTGMNCIESSEQ
jgi:hypothetical protein